MASCPAVPERALRALLALTILLLGAAPASTCTSFMLEAEDGIYFAHSLNQCSMDRVDGHVFINPRDTWKRGYGFPVLIGQEPDAEPELIWRSLYGSVTFNPLGREMPDGGMNEAGLFIWEMGFEPEYPVDETLPTLFQMQWMQYQLDNYATVEEVLANADRVTLDGWGWHYFVADRSGSAAIIDHLNGEAVVYTGRELPVPLCCNSSYPFAMEFLHEHEGFGGDIEVTQIFEEVPRFIYGAKLLRDYAGEEPVQYCLDTLGGMSRCVRWSIVFDVERMDVHFTTNVAADRRSVSFSSDDFAPERGTRMMDVNLPQSGDVTHELGPYDVEADTEVVAGILALFVEEPGDARAAAGEAVERLAYRDLANNYEVRGTWGGPVTVPDKFGDEAFPVTLRISGESGALSGTIEGELFGGTRPLHNVRFEGGLLDFTSRDSDSGQLLRFQLHTNGRTFEGSAWNWDWNNMMTIEENRTIAVLKLSRQPEGENVPDPRIEDVESGLVEIVSPAALFEAGMAVADSLVETPPTFTLAERMAHHNVPGVGIAVIEDGKIAWEKGYGVLSADREDPVTTESIFEAGSTSKFVTAILLLHYVEQGVFDLDTDVNEYLTSWKMPENEFTVEQKVTPHLLLQHRAGLPTTNFDDVPPEEAPSVSQVLTGRPAAGNEPATPVRPLGEEWVYSNLGCIVVQLMLEDTLDRPFSELMREVVLDPVGMTSSTVEYPLPPELADRETMPHDGEGVAHEPLMNYTAFGHAGLMTTPGDLALLFADVMRSYRGEEGGVLSPEMARAFLTPYFDIEPSPFGLPISEGLGVFLRGEGDAFMFFHPGGNTPGANSFPFALPEGGKGAVIMTNGLNGQVLFMEILASIMREYDWPR